MLHRGRPSPYWQVDTAGAAAAVDDAAAAVEQAEAKAAASPTPANEAAVDAAEARLRSAEDRLAKVEVSLTEMRQGVESRAPLDHDHPSAPPKEPEPDSQPKRVPWGWRRMGGH